MHISSEILKKYLKKGALAEGLGCTNSGVRFISVFFEIFDISETLDMSSKQLGEMFEGDSADTCGGKFPLMSMGG